jgi:transcriptional regulator with XRE-family HTH domain
MRTRAKLTLEEAAKALYRSKSTLHRLENGETILDVHLAKSMMDLYDQYDPDLVDQVLRAREPGWWTTYGIENQGYIDVETEAAHVRDVRVTPAQTHQAVAGERHPRPPDPAAAVDRGR